MNGRIVERWAKGRACVGRWMEQPRSIDDAMKTKKNQKKICSQQPGTLTRNLR
tara:strand:+ start:1973 stop:2131 length:159 start_codon:yes stop_codon:yes gene_type:complete